MKTITLCDEDGSPFVSICPGHVTASAYNGAFRAEGWGRGDWIYKDNLRYEYWARIKARTWIKSTREDKRAVPVTVSDW